MDLHAIRVIQVVHTLHNGRTEKAIFESVKDAKGHVISGVSDDVESAEIQECDHDMNVIRVISSFDGRRWNDRE